MLSGFLLFRGFGPSYRHMHFQSSLLNNCTMIKAASRDVSILIPGRIKGLLYHKKRPLKQCFNGLLLKKQRLIQRQLQSRFL